MAKRKQQKSKKGLIITLIVSLLLLAVGTFVLTNAETRKFIFGSFARTTNVNVNDSDYVIGLYYMPKPVSLSHQFQDLVTYNRLSDVVKENRVTKPLLGYYSGADQSVMDQQIQWASDYGIDYFIFDDFWSMGGDEPTYRGSIDTFIKSSYTNRLKFAAMITDLGVPTALPKLEEARSNFFINTIGKYYKDNYLNKDNYLKINGKPVVTIMYNIFGSSWNDSEKIKGYLRSFERKAGKEIYWIYSNPMINANANELKEIKERGFDSLAPYNMSPGVTFDIKNPRKEIDYKDYTKEAMNQNKAIFDAATTANIRFIPDASSNFDERMLYYKSPYMEKRVYLNSKLKCTTR